MIKNINSHILKNISNNNSKKLFNNTLLKQGEIFITKVQKFSNGKPIINIKGKLFLAESQIELKKGDKITVKVDGKINGKTNLKVINNLSNEITKFLKNNSLQLNKKNMLTATYLKDKGIKLTAKNIVKYGNLASKLGDNFIKNLQLITNPNFSDNINENIAKLLNNGLANSILKKSIEKFEKKYSEESDLKEITELIKKELKINDSNDIKDKLKKFMKNLGFDSEKKVGDLLDKKHKDSNNSSLKEKILKKLEDKSLNKDVKNSLKDVLDAITAKEIISKTNNFINFELIFSNDMGFNKAELIFSDNKDSSQVDEKKGDIKSFFLDLDMSFLKKLRVYGKKVDNYLNIDIYVDNNEIKEFLKDNIKELSSKELKNGLIINSVNIYEDREFLNKDILKELLGIDDNEDENININDSGLDIKV